MTDYKQKILAIVFLPPPHNGQSIFSKKLIENLSGPYDVETITINGGIARKIFNILYASYIILFRTNSSTKVYLTPPGNNGLYPYLIIPAVLKMKKNQCYVHHHSSRAITQYPQRGTKALFYLLKGISCHIFLCNCVSNEFKKLYANSDPLMETITLSNAFLFFNEQPINHEQGVYTLAHLSVITWDKGIEYFLKLASACILSTEYRFKFSLAGPVKDPDILSMIHDFAEKFPNDFEYQGAVFNNEKDEFFKQIDALILPSKLADETEPLVMYEAYSYGAEFFATDRGCIKSNIHGENKILTMNLEEDKKNILREAKLFYEDHLSYKNAAKNHGKELCVISQVQYKKFLSMLDECYTNNN